MWTYVGLNMINWSFQENENQTGYNIIDMKKMVGIVSRFFYSVHIGCESLHCTDICNMGIQMGIQMHALARLTWLA